MKKIDISFVLFSISLLLFIAGCRTTHVAGPEPITLHPKPTLSQVKKSLSPHPSAQQLPSALGGLIQSDRWVIYKDKQQEEFSGHVFYDNGTYVFRADYALSDRAHGTLSARGNVYLRQNNPDGSFYQAQADKAFYNYNTQQGTLQSNGKSRIKLISRDAKGQLLTATARKAQLDINKKIYILEKDVQLERTSSQGTQTVTAKKATLKQLQNYILLEGNAVVTDGKRTLTADTIVYDAENNTSHAYGARPLAQGITEQGEFAVIADEIQSDAAGNQIQLNGKVQGWFVSPQINDSKINTKF